MQRMVQQNVNEKPNYTNKKSENGLIKFLFMSAEFRTVSYLKTVIFYAVMGFLFIGFSILIFAAIGKIHEKQILYYSPSDKSNCNTGQTCTIDFQLQEDMVPPIYFMYQLKNFFQNHRRYIQSKSNYQLAGNQLQNSYQSIVCDPFITNRDMGKTESWGNVQLNPNAIASPCGAIAKTYFNDTYELRHNNGSIITINDTGISWPGDKGQKFKRAQNSSNTQWIDPEDQHFIVWMRTSGLPNFVKLWGRIQENLPAGSYQLLVKNQYNSSDWEGQRLAILTQNSAFGGKNFMLPSFIMILGVFCLSMSVVFGCKAGLVKRKNN